MTTVKNKRFNTILALSFAILVTFLSLQSRASEVPPVRAKCLLTLAIIDGESSGQFLPQAFRDYVSQNHPDKTPQVIHVHSEGKPPESMKNSFHPENFDQDYAHDGNFEKTAQWVNSFDPIAIVPGAEAGVIFSALLNNRFADKFGISPHPDVRVLREKFEQSEALRQAGVPSVFQIKSNSLVEIMTWVRKNKLLPGIVVLKPNKSSGSDGVTFCKSEAEIVNAFYKLHDSRDKYGNLNDFILVQEYLDGPEYVVNTVVKNGHIVITDIWLYTKRTVKGAGTIYVYDRLLPSQGQAQDIIVAYNNQVMKALGIENGWGHAEIKLTKRGAILVEIGNRMMGTGQPRLSAEALGRAQLELGTMSIVDPEKFMLEPKLYKFAKHASVVNLSSNKEGSRFSSRALKDIQNLSSYVRHSFEYEDGQVMKKTVDLSTPIAQIELINNDPRQLEQDIQKLLTWEKSGRFIQRK